MRKRKRKKICGRLPIRDLAAPPAAPLAAPLLPLTTVPTSFLGVFSTYF